jgi:hypothetical protein
MQRFFLTLVTVVACITLAARAQAGPSDLSAVMDQYATALGGRQTLSAIHSFESTYKSTIMGHDILIVTKAKAPYYFLQTFSAAGSTATTSVGFDGTTAWRQDPNGTVHTLSGQDRAELVSEAVGAMDSEIFPDRWPTTVTLRPTEIINGKTFSVLRIAPKDGTEHDVLIEQQSGLPLVERTVQGQVSGMTVVESFSKGPMGELQARVMVSQRSDGTPQITSVLSGVKDNVSYPDALFAPPIPSTGSQSI